MSKSYVLDASAVLDFAEDGPGGKRVEQLLKDALLQRTRVLMLVLTCAKCSITRGNGRVKTDLISRNRCRPAESGLVTKSHLSIALQRGWRSCTKLFW